jgi:peptidoglycan/LPS O-acetylase OafA/YrhL
MSEQWGAFLFFSIGYLAIAVFMLCRYQRYDISLLKRKPRYFLLFAAFVLAPVAAGFAILYHSVLPFPKGALTWGWLAGMLASAVLEAFHFSSRRIEKKRRGRKRIGLQG